MRRALSLLLSTLLFVGLLGAVASAETGKVGIIDLQVVVDESQAGKDANERLNELITNRQNALDELESEIFALETSLEEEATPLSAEEKAARETELNQILTEYMTRVNQYEAEIQDLAHTLQDAILTEIRSVLQVFGDNSDYSVILDSSAAFYFRHSVDITWDIIDKYNELKAAGRL